LHAGAAFELPHPVKKFSAARSNALHDRFPRQIFRISPRVAESHSLDRFRRRRACRDASRCAAAIMRGWKRPIVVLDTAMTKKNPIARTIIAGRRRRVGRSGGVERCAPHPARRADKFFGRCRERVPLVRSSACRCCLLLPAHRAELDRSGIACLASCARRLAASRGAVKKSAKQREFLHHRSTRARRAIDTGKGRSPASSGRVGAGLVACDGVREVPHGGQG